MRLISLKLLLIRNDAIYDETHNVYIENTEIGIESLSDAYESRHKY